MATKMECGHRLAERRVGRLEHVVHFGCEPRRNVPIVRIRKHMVAALELDVAIASGWLSGLTSRAARTSALAGLTASLTRSATMRGGSARR